MVIIRVPRSWEISENCITPESAFLNRRWFMQSLLGAGVSIAIAPGLISCQNQTVKDSSEPSLEASLEASLKLPKLRYRTNPSFNQLDRPLTANTLAGQYNNFYEFGGTKEIWPKAQKLPLKDWQVRIEGLVKTPTTYDLDDLTKVFPLEERLYRFRCVEAWSMAIPWVGFPMRRIIEAVEPSSAAKYVRLTSFYDPQVGPGPQWFGKILPWPYTEGLRIEEMANDLAFFAVGIYGRELPKQHGAPIRAVLPWKYGFKGAKSIVKIEFVAERPKTFWHTVQPNEYDFEANVNPQVPHPRWSQAKERFIGAGPNFAWEEKETLSYNGYGEFVASLYA